MELTELLHDMSPEELEPRLELQMLVDPIALSAESNNNLNCAVAGACNIKQAG